MRTHPLQPDQPSSSHTDGGTESPGLWGTTCATDTTRMRSVHSPRVPTRRSRRGKPKIRDRIGSPTLPGQKSGPGQTAALFQGRVDAAKPVFQPDWIRLVAKNRTTTAAAAA